MLRTMIIITLSLLGGAVAVILIFYVYLSDKCFNEHRTFEYFTSRKNIIYRWVGPCDKGIGVWIGIDTITRIFHIVRSDGFVLNNSTVVDSCKCIKYSNNSLFTSLNNIIDFSYYKDSLELYFIFDNSAKIEGVCACKVYIENCDL